MQACGILAKCRCRGWSVTKGGSLFWVQQQSAWEWCTLATQLPIRAASLSAFLAASAESTATSPRQPAGSCLPWLHLLTIPHWVYGSSGAREAGIVWSLAQEANWILANENFATDIRWFLYVALLYKCLWCVSLHSDKWQIPSSGTPCTSSSIDFTELTH